MRALVILVAVTVALGASAVGVDAGAGTAPVASPTTAWRDGHFGVDVPGLVRRSDVVLGHANLLPAQAMPLGNGGLGAGVWAAGGFSAQLNRADTLPDRKSPGLVKIPGLAALTSAPDFSGRLNLYDATLVESGGGMTARAYVRADRDELVVDVTGADPAVPQIAQVSLWAPRQPVAGAGGGMGTLAETWVDAGRPGATGQTFGSVAAVTAEGRDVQATVVDPLTVRVGFLPRRDGSFRVVVAAPRWTGGDAAAAARRLLSGQAGDEAGDEAGDGRSAHLRWWHDFWSRVGPMRLQSADGAAQYFENLRLIDLYTAAAERGSEFPGAQAGVADLFATTQDYHRWDPAAYWHWNLRMQVAANLGAGAFALNDPYFRLYRDNLAAIEAWTQAQMGGRPGACVPETMRFNGVGIQFRGVGQPLGFNCDAASPPFFNARTLSSGAEVSLWIWRQFLATGDRDFLEHEYPVMADAARFLLAYAQPGPDGLLHTQPSNAHESQWDVRDPTTDIAAMDALFPAVIQAARLLDRDDDLVQALRAALPRIPPLPRTDAATERQLLTPADDALGTDVIGRSTSRLRPCTTPKTSAWSRSGRTTW